MATTAPSPPHGSSSPLSSMSVGVSRCVRLKVERYEENELASDPTSKILFAFLDHLPPDGLRNIVQDIQDAPDLRALANHYFSAILVPSTFSYLLIPLLPLIPAPFIYHLNSPSQRWQDTLSSLN
jgi:hypothetical protein